MSRPRATWPPRSRPRSPPTPPCWSPPSPTGASTAAPQKLKKDGSGPPTLTLVENPDILAGLATSPRRPRLLIGFAAETEHVVAHAHAKLARKGCDWIVANDVSGDVMGGDGNTVHLVTAAGVEDWPRMDKRAVADRLADRIMKRSDPVLQDRIRVEPE